MNNSLKPSARSLKKGGENERIVPLIKSGTSPQFIVYLSNKKVWESDDGGRFATIEPEVMVNHAGTILIREKLVMGENGYVRIEEYGFEESMTLDEWLAEYN